MTTDKWERTYAHALESLVFFHRIIHVPRQKALEPLILLLLLLFFLIRMRNLALLSFSSCELGGTTVVYEFSEELDGSVDERCLAFLPVTIELGAVDGRRGGGRGRVGKQQLAEDDEQALERGAIDENLEYGICKTHVTRVDQTSGVYFLQALLDSTWSTG